MLEAQEKQAGEDSKRLSAGEIFSAAMQTGRDELNRSTRALGFSGFTGGITMGLTGLAVACIEATVGSTGWSELAGYILYPIGFISVVIGRGQLFTENTLYPVILVLDERNPRHVRNLARLWLVVFVANVAGALSFAALAIASGALKQEIATALVALGNAALNQPDSRLFFGGIIGGWLIALVAWVVTASHWTIGQVIMVWLLTFVVGIGHFAHCIATSGEILAAVIAGTASVGAYLHWLLLATLGNIVGGVIIVSLLNYGQVKET
jgi:formate/nitrite transporter FocA (FNT family)